MRKIVTPPKPIKCPECGCEFTFDAEDIKCDSYWNPSAFLGILGLSQSCRGVRCPVCNHLYVIEKC